MEQVLGLFQGILNRSLEERRLPTEMVLLKLHLL